MDRAQALELLPESYARALTLRERGSCADDIAMELGIVVEAVPPLLRIADAKLARLLDERRSPDGPPSRPRESATHEADLEGQQPGLRAVVAPQLDQGP